MYNYYTDTILKIDIALICIIVLLGFIIVIYSAVQQGGRGRRSRALFAIKKNVYELVLSGRKITDKAQLSVIAGASTRQFLDIVTNKNRGAVFFNESEQKIFMEYFLTPEKILAIEKMAGNRANKWRRIEAIMALGYTSVASSAETLEKTLHDKDEDIAYFSIIALGQLKTARSAEILLDFLQKKRFCRYKIASVLEGFPGGISDQLAVLLDDKDEDVRLWAMKILSKFRPQKYVKKIEAFTEDRSADMRADACDCLGEIKDKTSAPAVKKCLGDDTWFVRMKAVRALSSILGEKSIPEIKDMINDGSLSVIDSVKSVMAEHIEASLPYLEGFLRGKDELAQKIAAEVLELRGYVSRFFKDILAATEGNARAMKFLECLVKSKAHAGLEAALISLEDGERSRIMEIIKVIDPEFARHIEQRIMEGS